MRRFLLLIAAALVTLLTACSFVTLAYNNANAVLSYSLDDYFDLNDEQREWLKPRTEAFIAWHRASELPIYQRVLADARVRGREPFTGEDLGLFIEQGQGLLQRLVERAEPDMAAFVLQLLPEQLLFLEKKFERDNAKMRRDIVAPLAKRQKLRLTRYLDRLEDWMGPLTALQTAQVTEGLARYAPLDELRLADRIKRQGEFLRIARQRPDAATLGRELRVLLVHPERLREPSQQAEWTRQQTELTALMAAVVSSATPAQKARIDKRFSTYARDIVNLMKNG